ncbi:MAG: isopeptide-forming domain-containing fimbrial protein, partial [Chloroflexi bacterium]|nr:isopeptide-forming domain-containing fimbrial protein [Chloroflexota bacterium]
SPGPGATTLISTTPTVTPGWLQSGAVVWRLGDLAGAVQINGVITAVIQNIASNQDGVRRTNEIAMTYVDDGQPYVFTDTAAVDILEPVLHIAKSHITPHGCNATLFQDNFNDGDDTDWTGDSGWIVADGTYVAGPGGLGTGRFAGDASWVDYSLSAMVRTGTDGSGGLYFRRQDATHYYLFMWRENLDQLDLLLVNGGAPLSIGAAAPWPWQPGRQYHIEVRVEGGRLRAFVDGQLAYDVFDATLTSGGVGVGGSDDTSFFDDILVARLGDMACTVGANDQVTYTLTISNQWQLAGYDLLIIDALPAGMSLVTYTLKSDDPATIVETEPAPIPGATGVLTWSINQLAAITPFTTADHTALTVTVVLRVSNAITANTILDNQAFLSYDNWEQDGDPAGDPYGIDIERSSSGGSHSNAVRTVDGGIAKTVRFSPPPTATLGTLVTYTLIVPAQPITATLYDVHVFDTLDSRLQLQSVTDGPDGAVQISGNTITATYPSIAHGEQRSITITAVLFNPLGAVAGDVITNLAVLAHSTGGPTSSNVVTTTIIEPDLILTKDADPPGGSVRDEGDPITYTVLITNAAGPAAGPAYDLVIWDTLPLWMRAAPPQIQSITIDGTGVTTSSQSYDSVSGQLAITLTPSISLPVGGRLAITYLTRVDVGVPSGLTLTNRAQAGYSSLPGEIPGDRDYTTNRDDETHYTPIATGLRKFVTPLTATIGSQLVYTYQVPFPPMGATLNNVVFTDALPANLTVTGVSGDGGFVSGWSGGNLVTGTVA